MDGDIRFCTFFLAIRKSFVSLQTNYLKFYNVFPIIFDWLLLKQCFYVCKCQHKWWFITLQIENVRSANGRVQSQTVHGTSQTPFWTNTARSTDKRDHHAKPYTNNIVVSLKISLPQPNRSRAAVTETVV